MLSAIILLITIFYFFHYHCVQKRKQYPPGPLPLPFLGNTAQLDEKDPHKTFIEWRKKYGNVYTVWIGNEPHIVICDYKTLQETLVNQGDTFAGRTENFVFADFINGQQYGVVINDGEIWREQRRFSLHVLRDFGFGRPLMEEKIMQQVDQMLISIDSLIPEGSQTSNKAISLAPQIELAVANIISSLLLGHTLDEGTSFRTIRKCLTDLNAISIKPETFMLGWYPWLRYLPFRNHFGWDDWQRGKTQFHEYLGREVREHKVMDPNDEATDYTGAFLKEIRRRGDEKGSFTETQLVAALIDLWTAGMETTLTTLKWGILYMVRHPDVQEKCFNEIENLLESRGSNRLKMSDKPQTPMLAATIAEIQRCANLVPINLPHKTMKDTVVAGWPVKRGTAILPQISVLLADERIFTNADKFDPNRFLSQEGKKKLDMVIPFSLGKRSCLGQSLARMELYLIFGTLIHKFKLSVAQEEGLPSEEGKVGFVRTPKEFKHRITRR